jgi:hypothetical protein
MSKRKKNAEKLQSLAAKLVTPVQYDINFPKIGSKKWWKELGKQFAITYGIIFAIIGYLALHISPLLGSVVDFAIVFFVVVSYFKMRIQEHNLPHSLS